MPTGVEGTKLTEMLVVPTGTEGTVQEMLVPLTEQFPTANPPPVALTRLGLEPPPVTTLVKVTGTLMASSRPEFTMARFSFIAAVRFVVMVVLVTLGALATVLLVAVNA